VWAVGPGPNRRARGLATTSVQCTLISRKAGVIVDFSEPVEHRDLRDAIRPITDKYGCAYFVERAAAHEPTTELWQDLAHHGFSEGTVKSHLKHIARKLDTSSRAAAVALYAGIATAHAGESR
jgi:hypothetical protein